MSTGSSRSVFFSFLKFSLVLFHAQNFAQPWYFFSPFQLIEQREKDRRAQKKKEQEDDRRLLLKTPINWSHTLSWSPTVYKLRLPCWLLTSFKFPSRKIASSPVLCLCAYNSLTVSLRSTKSTIYHIDISHPLDQSIQNIACSIFFFAVSLAFTPPSWIPAPWRKDNGASRVFFSFHLYEEFDCRKT